jgi:hypothetical protein
MWQPNTYSLSDFLKEEICVLFFRLCNSIKDDVKWVLNSFENLCVFIMDHREI